jgi:hypothetical protein
VLASLRKYRNYRLYFLGQIVSYSGTFVQDTALPWLVLEVQLAAPDRLRGRVSRPRSAARSPSTANGEFSADSQKPLPR